MARNFDLSVRLRTAVEGLRDVTALISEIEDLGGTTEGAATRSKELSDELRELEKKQSLVDNFRDLRQEVNRTGDELQEAQQEAQRLGRELSETSQPTKKLERDFERARKTVQRLKDEQIEHVQALQRNRGELDKVGLSSRRLNEAQADIRRSMDATGDEIEQLTRSLKDARDASAKQFKDPTDKLERGARQADQAVEGLGARIRRTAGIAIGSAAAFFGIREAIQGVGNIVKVGANFELLRKQLEALTGSAEAGEEAFEWIQEFTQKTPFQMEQVTQAFIRAKAFGLDPMDGTLQAVADQVAKTGGGVEELNGVVAALGQAFSKGKLQTEEMLQLIERGVPAWDLLADATGRSTQELQKMSSAGELGRREIKLLIEEIGKSADGAAAAAVGTLTGQFSNLLDQIRRFTNEINKAGLLEYVKDQIRALGDAFDRMKASGELEEWAKGVSDGIIGIAEGTRTLIGAIRDNVAALGFLAKAYVALKLSSVFKSTTRLAGALGGALLSSTVSVTKATRALGDALTKIGWLLVIEKAIETAASFIKLRDAQRDLTRSQELAASVQAEATARIEEFNKQTGLAAESVRDMIKLQEDGVVVLDEYTGLWRLTSEELTEAEKAQRAQAEAMEDAKAEAAAFNAEVRGLVDTFKASRSEGQNLEQAIEGIGGQAAAKGADGVRNLSIALERLALEGEATREELSDGLAQFLEGLTGKEYTAFGEAIAKELERLKNGADDASNRLSFMATILDGSLKAAARRLGLDLGEVLQGIDTDTRQAISAFSDMAREIQSSSVAAEQADNLIKAGLSQTLKTLDSTEEVQATIAAIESLGEQGLLTSAQVLELTSRLEAQADKLRDTKTEADRASDSLSDMGDQAEEAGEQLESTGRKAESMGSGIAGFYNRITSNLAALSQKTLAAFGELTGGSGKVTSELDVMRNRVEALGEGIRALELSSVGAGSRLTKWFIDTAKASNTAEREFLRQKIALEELIEQFDNGEQSSRYLAYSVQDLEREFSLLDDQDLGRLSGAIDRVNAEVESLKDSLQDTISSLRQELASLEGDTAEVERLRYQEQALELEEQLQRARALGDREAAARAQEAAKLAEQAYRLRLAEAQERTQEEAQRQAEEERRRQRDEVEQRERTAADFAREDRQAQEFSGRTTTVIIQGPDGTRIPVQTEQEGDLISLLESLGRRVS